MYYRFNFRVLSEQTSHIQQVLDGSDSYLVETYSQNTEWEAELQFHWEERLSDR